MIARDEVTFIVQGPLHSLGLSCVPKYLERGHVIISSWTNCDLSLLNNLGPDLKRVRVVLGSREGIEDYKNDGTYDNTGNSYLQCLSTLAGLKQVETKYAIKVRGDEYLPKWDNFFARLETGKFIHSNRFARKALEPFHLGDTYFGGPTDLLHDGFLWFRYMAKHHKFKNLDVCGRTRHLSAEQKITLSLIRASLPYDEFNDPIGVVKTLFDICPLSEMGEFAINSSGWKKDGLPNPRYEFNTQKWGCIDSLDSL